MSPCTLQLSYSTFPTSRGRGCKPPRITVRAASDRNRSPLSRANSPRHTPSPAHPTPSASARWGGPECIPVKSHCTCPSVVLGPRRGPALHLARRETLSARLARHSGHCLLDAMHVHCERTRCRGSKTVTVRGVRVRARTELENFTCSFGSLVGASRVGRCSQPRTHGVQGLPVFAASRTRRRHRFERSPRVSRRGVFAA